VTWELKFYIRYRSQAVGCRVVTSEPRVRSRANPKLLRYTKFTSLLNFVCGMFNIVSLAHDQGGI